MSLMKCCPSGRPGGLRVLLLAATVLAAALTGGAATAAEQGTPGEQAAVHGRYVWSATDNPELPDVPCATLEGLGAKSDALRNQVSDLIDDGVPIDGVGLQGHLAIQHGFPAGMRQNLQRFAGLGLDLAVTELDVRVELPAGALKARYRSNDGSTGNNRIKPGLQLVNTGVSTVDLPAVTVRYRFTGESGTASYKVQYKNTDSSSTDNQIRLTLRLLNTGSAPVDLSTVTLRYWFSSEGGASTFSTYCDYAALGSSNISHRVAAVSSPKAGAGRSLDVTLTGGAGALAAGASTGDIQLRLNKSDWSNFNEADDYSRAANTSYADAPKVGVYVNGALAWGTAP